MRLLIAAPTCDEYAERRQACERTWGADAKGLCDVKFYTAADMGVPLEEGRIKTDHTGGWVTRPGQSLNYRLREMCRWALAQGYDYVFKCDDDTYIRVDRLLASGFEGHDYYGFSQWWHDPPFASGGAGYWMSRRALGALASQEGDLGIAAEWPDDVWAGIVMRDSGISLVHDARYIVDLPAVLPRDWITVHYVKNPAVMEALHMGAYPCQP